MIRLIRLMFWALLLGAGPAVAGPRTQAALHELLGADRALSAMAAQESDAASGLAGMFDAGIVMPVPGRGHVIGHDAALTALRDIPAFREGRARWTPVRGGVSADGTHGFTFGFLTLDDGPADRRNRKYLAYWVRRPEGWRVVAYRQNVRQAGEVSLEMLPASLPGFEAEPTADQDIIAAHQRSLAAAEQAFSDRAQQVGLRTAFHEYGRSDAMNMYDGAGFRYGLEAVVAGFPEGQAPSPVRWGTERSFVASSGDLGVSIGTIHQNGPVAAGQPSSLPFFTIWRRDGPDTPWRYIAE